MLHDFQNLFEYYYSLWIQNDILIYGIGPVLSFIIGYFFTAIPLEILIRQSWVSSYLVTYPGSHSNSRMLSIEKTQKNISIYTQFFHSNHSAFNNLFGFNAILSGVCSYYIFKSILPTPDAISIYPEVSQAIIQYCALHVIGDFILYWGHRVQHDIPYLWEHCHSVHHALETPTPLSAIYIHHIDAFLQGSLPILLSTAIVQPHIFIWYLSIALRIAENTANHSGLSGLVFDCVTLKVLPFRASASHHDSHHKYSHYGRNAKNYGEFYWIWDYIFGTMRV